MFHMFWKVLLLIYRFPHVSLKSQVLFYSILSIVLYLMILKLVMLHLYRAPIWVVVSELLAD